MEAAAANALYDLLHKDMPFHDGTFAQWSKERSRDFPYHYRDGVNVWVSPVDFSPNDRFLTDRNAPVVAPDPRGGEHGDKA